MDWSVDLLSEGNGIELFLDGPMEQVADAVGLRAFGLGFGIINVFDDIDQKK